MKKKSIFDGGIGVGGTSLLAVFVILCLTTFAVLSLISANADLRLSRKTAEATAAYYAADAKAQTLLSQLALSAEKSGDPQGFALLAAGLEGVTAADSESGRTIVAFSFPVDETRLLSGSVDVTDALSGGKLQTLSYRVRPAQENAAEKSPLPIWTPEAQQ